MPFHAYCSVSSEAQETPKHWCRDHFLDFDALQLANKASKELQITMESEQIYLISTPFEDKAYYTNIRRALVTGFFMRVAKKGDRRSECIYNFEGQSIGFTTPQHIAR